jgi:AsmA protein
MRKLWVRIAVSVAVVVVFIVVLTPFFVHADSFRPILEQRMSAALERKVTLGHLSFSLLSGSLTTEDIAIADDPAFSAAPFLQAKRFAIGVETLPLLLHRKMIVTHLTIDKPAIQLIQAQGGKWNFSSLGNTSASPASTQPTAIPDLSVRELKIVGGSASVSSLPATAKPFVYTDINLKVEEFSLTSSFPFKLSASLPANGSVQLTGKAGPMDKTDASATPFSAALDLKNFDPVATGAVNSSQGISMLVNLHSEVVSDGKTVTNSGKIQADRLHLARTGSPAPNTVQIDYATTHNLATREGEIKDISLHAGSVAAHLNGTYHLKGRDAVLALRMSAPHMPIDQLQQLLPAVGVELPSGSSLRGGELNANFAISGTSTAPVIAGPVEVVNTRLAGFDLGSRIQGLNPFGGSGGGTAIQKLSVEVNSTLQSTRFSNIDAELPQVGSASGNGTASTSGALDFQLVAKFNASTGIGAVAGKAVNTLTGFLHNTLHTKSGNGIPLTITGTASNPSIRANLKAMF